MRDLTYPPVIGSARVMFKLLNMKFDLVGGEHLPESGGAVLASNHVSYLDFIFCGYAARPSNRLVRFMAKKSTFDHKVSGPIMRSMHHIPVDRSAGAASFSEALEALQSGEVVGVFPEATISQSFEPKSFKNGAARLAAQAEVPLVPMVLFGGQRIWTKGRKAELRRGVLITMRVGEPIHVAPTDDPNEATEELRRRMNVLYEEMIESYPDKPTLQDSATASGEVEPASNWWWPARLGGSAPTPEEVAERRKRTED